MDEAERESKVSIAPEATLAAGALVGRYVVLDVIGRGGMGVVYAAYDAQLGRKIAIKLLRTSLTSLGGNDALARILREAQAMARLSHPNVVTVYDVGAFGDDNVFLAMDLVEGCTLKEWLESAHTWRDVLDVMTQAGRGLAAAHAAGLVHRDFKPDNVLIGNDGRARVTDFGIARAEGVVEKDTVDVEIEPPSPSTTSSAGVVVPLTPLPMPPPPPPAVLATESSPSGQHVLSDPITVTGTILGTIGYMPPEQGMSEGSSARSDQFSFCVTLYIALFGERPFPGETTEEYLNALERHIVTPPKSSGVPAWVRRIVLKGLSKRAEDRHESMEALLDALEKDPARAQRRLLGWGTVAMCVVAGAFGMRRWAQHEQQICAADPSLLAGAWDDGVKEQVHRAFAATGAPSAEETYERVSQKLDEQSAAWTKAHAEACEATLVRREKSMDVMATRMACLDRGKTELAALTSVFAKADAQVMRRAVAATFDLPAPASCANVNGLQAQVGLPDDPATRDRVVSARADLARAESLRLSGKYKESLAVAEPTLDAARAIPHAETEAEVLYSVGQTRELIGDYAGTEEPYEGAVFAAERAGNDALIARASARLAFVVGDKLSRTHESDEWQGLAEAAASRLGPNDDVEADVTQAKAVLFTTAGHPELALPLAERLVGIRERTLGKSHLMTARALNNLGYTYQLLAEQEKALGPHLESLAIREGVFGADDPALAVDYSNIGSSELGLGRYDDAIASLRHAVDIASRGNPNSFWAAWALQFLGVALTRTGDAAGGLEAARRGLAVIANVKSEEQRVTPPLLVVEGFALLARGDAASARGRCARAAAMQEAAGAIDPERVYGWDALACEGEADIALGKPKDALAPLSRSVALERRTMPGDLARARFALAQALSATGDAARARPLAEQAKAELSALPARPEVLDAVESFLAAR